MRLLVVEWWGLFSVSWCGGPGDRGKVVFPYPGSGLYETWCAFKLFLGLRPSTRVQGYDPLSAVGRIPLSPLCDL